jgi:hypothetical protein
MSSNAVDSAALEANHATELDSLSPTPTLTPNGLPKTTPSDNNFVQVQMEPLGTDEDGGYVDDPTACINGQNQVYYSTTVSNNGAQHQKPSIQGDMLNSVNNLRLNVNNRIIGKMRKISITELNRRRRSSKHARFYRLAFYVAISSLSFLFLYLIYQNLFSDG